MWGASSASRLPLPGVPTMCVGKPGIFLSCTKKRKKVTMKWVTCRKVPLPTLHQTPPWPRPPPSFRTERADFFLPHSLLRMRRPAQREISLLFVHRARGPSSPELARFLFSRLRQEAQETHHEVGGAAQAEKAARLTLDQPRVNTFQGVKLS